MQELVIHETTKVEPPDLPPGATFRQFESLVQTQAAFCVSGS
jgi:hypothetical protein